jgi:hypothetical protein
MAKAKQNKKPDNNNTTNPKAQIFKSFLRASKNIKQNRTQQVLRKRDRRGFFLFGRQVEFAREMRRMVIITAGFNSMSKGLAPSGTNLWRLECTWRGIMKDGR